MSTVNADAPVAMATASYACERVETGIRYSMSVSASDEVACSFGWEGRTLNAERTFEDDEVLANLPLRAHQLIEVLSAMDQTSPTAAALVGYVMLLADRHDPSGRDPLLVPNFGISRPVVLSSGSGRIQGIEIPFWDEVMAVGNSARWFAARRAGLDPMQLSPIDFCRHGMPNLEAALRRIAPQTWDSPGADPIADIRAAVHAFNDAGPTIQAVHVSREELAEMLQGGIGSFLAHLFRMADEQSVPDFDAQMDSLRGDLQSMRSAFDSDLPLPDLPPDEQVDDVLSKLAAGLEEALDEVPETVAADNLTPPTASPDVPEWVTSPDPDRRHR